MNFLLINKYPKFREEYLKYSNESDASENPDSWSSIKKSYKRAKKNLFIEIKDTMILIKSKPNKTLPELCRIDAAMAKELNTDPCIVYIRPFTKCFLRTLSKNFRIIVYSEIPPLLLNHIVDLLQQNRKLIYLWISNYRTNLVKNLGQFLGDSSKFNSDVCSKDSLNDRKKINSKNSVIIDQDPQVAVRNSSNWVPVLKYRGMSNDSTLLYLEKYLLELSTFDDVTMKIVNDFKLGIMKTNLNDSNLF